MTPTSDRRIRLQADAFLDIFDGDLQVIVNFDEGWRVGIIRNGPGPDLRNRLLCMQLIAAGVPLLDLTEEDIACLRTGLPTAIQDPSGRRYLLCVDDIGELEDLLAEQGR